MLIAYIIKKLVLVLTTSVLMTGASIETVFVIVFIIDKSVISLKALILNNKAFLLLEHILYIYYSIYFKKD